MSAVLSDDVIDDVVFSHALDAAFLWMQRERACTAPNYNLRELAALDARLEGHLEGLNLAGEPGLAVYQDMMGEDPGDAFVLATVSAHLGPEHFDKTIDSFADKPETIPAIISALSWMPVELARPFIERYLAAEQASRRCIAIGAAVCHRLDLGAHLSDAAVHDDAALRALALWGAGELGRDDMQLPLQRSFNDVDLTCRYQARRSALLLGMPDTARTLEQATLSERPESDDACRLAMGHSPAAVALELHTTLASQESTLRLAVIGAGATGDPVYVPWILQAMERPDCARVAIDALVGITGVDVEAEELLGDKPEGYEEGPSPDPADSNVEIPDDATIPWPNVNAATAWWHDQGASKFTPGTRYLMGQTRDTRGLGRVLAQGSQRLRVLAAFELAKINPERGVTFDTRAPASRQKSQLAAMDKP